MLRLVRRVWAVREAVAHQQRVDTRESDVLEAECRRAGRRERRAARELRVRERALGVHECAVHRHRHDARRHR